MTLILLTVCVYAGSLAASALHRLTTPYRMLAFGGYLLVAVALSAVTA